MCMQIIKFCIFLTDTSTLSSNSMQIRYIVLIYKNMFLLKRINISFIHSFMQTRSIAYGPPLSDHASTHVATNQKSRLLLSRHSETKKSFGMTGIRTLDLELQRKSRYEINQRVRPLDHHGLGLPTHWYPPDLPIPKKSFEKMSA